MTSAQLLLGAAAAAVLLAVVGATTWTSAAGEHEDIVLRGGGRPARRLELRARIDRLLRRTDTGRRLAERLRASGLGWTTIDLVALVLATGGAVLVVSATVMPLWAAALLAALAVRGLLAYVDRRQQARHEAFVQQMPELARVLSNASSAGLSLPTGLVMASREMAEPACEELGRVVAEIGLGVAIDDALSHLVERIPSREIGVLVHTIVIQQRAGGDIVAALRELASTLEQRRELRREIRTMLAGEVFSGYLIVGVGIGSLFLVNVYSPGVLDRMLSSPTGVLAVAIAAGFFAAAWFAMKRITHVEV